MYMNKKIMKFMISFLTLMCVSSLSFSSVQLEVLNTNPTPLIAGDYGDVTIKIINNQINSDDNSLENVELTIPQNPYVTFIESDSKKVSNLRPGEFATRTFRVYVEENTPQGFLSVPVRVKTNNDNSIFYERFYVDGFENRVNLSIGKISATPQLLIKDSTYNSIEVEIFNMGEKDARLTTATLVSVDGEMISSYSFSNQDSIGTIGNGDIKTATFIIDILDIETQIINSQVQISYQEEFETSSFEKVDIILPIRIELSPTPDFSVLNVEQISDFRHETTENIFKVTLENTGSKTAENVRVRVVPDKSYPFIFEESVVYAQSQVKVGETIEVEFKSEVTSGIAKDYQLKLDIESLINFDTFVEDEYITITTIEGEDNFNSNYLLIIFGVIILFTVVIGFNKLRSKNSQKDEDLDDESSNERVKKLRVKSK